MSAENEVLGIDGEEFQSCFNLFTLPEAWHGYMAFEKRVQWSVFDRPGGGDAFVAVTIMVVAASHSCLTINPCTFKRLLMSPVGNS